MSAGFHLDLFEDGEKTNRCSVVSLYEDFGTRDLLLGICDSLAWTFRDEMEFNTEWWRFKFLSDPEIGLEAAHKASGADLILVAAHSTELPRAVQLWFEGWLPNRTADDGALVLVQPALKPGVAPPIPLMTYLRATAQRAHLDYLRLGLPQSAEGLMHFPIYQPEFHDLISPDNHPQHWGINE